MRDLLKRKHNIVIVGLVVVFFGLGFFAGNAQSDQIDRIIPVGLSAQAQDDVNLGPFWKTWNAIDDRHPEAQDTSDKQRVYGAIKGLVSSLEDPYSVFFDPEETKAFEEDISGNFSGVGMEIGIKDGILTVIAPLKNTPAYRAGMRSGDKILKIDDMVTTDISVDEAVKLIRGEVGTQVTLTVFRQDEEEPKEIEITRDVIEMPTLDTETTKEGVFVIRLYSFSANSTKLFRDAMKKFADSQTDKLILDLRGNPGGYLEAAVDMASWFLDNGKTVVLEQYTSGEETKYRSYGYNIFNDNLKFVILIDGGSASASEILAGALRDHGKATLVGAKSYGKGSVQEVVDITRDTILKVTVAKWLTPNGDSISEKGLTPDHEVELTREDLENKRDPQMDKAVELLLNM